LSWSYAELDARVDAAAASLTKRGIQPGGRVGIMSPNGPGFVVAVHALMRLGAVLVPLNTRLTDAELTWQQDDAELATVLDEQALRELAWAPTASYARREFDLEACHSVIYTSGTTGRPKGA